MPENKPNPTRIQTANDPPLARSTLRSSTSSLPRSASSRAVEPYHPTQPWSSTPFWFMQRFMNEMDRLLGDFSFARSGSPDAFEWTTPTMWTPQVDVFERGGQLIVHADIPGLRQEDVRVNVADGMLTISGERRHEHEHEAGGVYRCERSYGNFRRTIALPDGVEPGSVKATFDNGVLEVTMPAPPQRSAQGRNVPIGRKTEGGGIQH